jgi:hypothetical protein
MWGTPALAADTLLTDHQLDSITAGTVGDNAAQAITGNVVTPSTNDATVQDGLNFGSPSAENVANVPTVNVNDSAGASQNVNSKNEYVVLKDYTQSVCKSGEY